MLSDRSYMRDDYPRQTTSALTWVLCATLAGAVVQWTIGRLSSSGNFFEQLMALTPFGLAHGRVWTLLSYAFLHDGLLHLFFNCLGLYFIGREVAPLLGFSRFLQFYAASAVLGAIVWSATHWFGGGTMLMGASACVAAMFIFFACVYPEREITFLLFLILPVTLRPKVMAWALVGFDLLGFAFSELPGGKFDTNIAHSAHLGGMLAGWLYFRFVYARHGADGFSSSPAIELPTWLRRRKSAVGPESSAPKFRVDLGGKAPTPDLRAEVDRILDKINSQGFGALTEQEKRLLDDAKDMLSRR
ncbi:MAG: rhomboid family intramembrane serine protease [Opitutus sp.]|nr:rhomboid family intramembrane serine protease [Opitutus sp.]